MGELKPESGSSDNLGKPQQALAGDHTAAEPATSPLAGGAGEAFDRLEKHSVQRLNKSTDDLAAANAGMMAGFARFAAMGFEFFGVILIFGLVGHWLDDKYGFGGIATIVAVLIAFVGEMYLQIKTILRKNNKK